MTKKRCTQPGTTLSFNLSAADADGDELKWYIQGSQNEESCDLLHGKLEWDKNTLSYMPFAGHSGEDQFKYVCTMVMQIPPRGYVQFILATAVNNWLPSRIERRWKRTAIFQSRWICSRGTEMPQA
jgi:hypothetical protein